MPPPPQALCTDHGAVNLTGLLLEKEFYPSNGGGYADVYRGVLQQDSSPCQVTIKVICSHVYDEENQPKLDKRLRREIKVWAQLKHPNVLPLYGVTLDFGLHAAMVCPWADNGNLNRYLKCHGDALTLTKRFEIICDVVAGLAYLHSCRVVHGDLTGANILLNSDSRALLSDFGLSRIIAEVHGTSYLSSSIGGALRWSSPLLYSLTGRIDSTSADRMMCEVHSFGSVMLQTLSGEFPYHEMSDVQVVLALANGNTPTRPSQGLITDEYWNYIQRCWGAQSGVMLTASQVSTDVQRFLCALTPPPPKDCVPCKGRKISCRYLPGEKECLECQRRSLICITSRKQRRQRQALMFTPALKTTTASGKVEAHWRAGRSTRGHHPI